MNRATYTGLVEIIRAALEEGISEHLKHREPALLPFGEAQVRQDEREHFLEDVAHRAASAVASALEDEVTP